MKKNYIVQATAYCLFTRESYEVFFHMRSKDAVAAKLNLLRLGKSLDIDYKNITVSLNQVRQNKQKK